MWDYPRPPALEPTDAHLVIVLGGVTIADTRRAYRVLETSHPPNYYLPPDDVVARRAGAGPRHVVLRVEGPGPLPHGARRRPRGGRGRMVVRRTRPPRFAPIAGYVAFYPGRMDACFVDGEPVVAPGRRLLRRLDHVRRRRPVQG